MKQLITSILAIAVCSIATAQTIYPTPQSIKKGDGIVSLATGVNFQGADQADKVALEMLETLVKPNKKGIKFRIGEVGDKIYAKETINIPKTSGAYYLKTDPKDGVTIIGADDRGTYYAVQTLVQLLSNGILPVVEITDYPDIKFRGSVEGFYGKPWSHRDRLAQLKFYGENKLNTYIYGPKDDPYHSSLSNHDGSNKEGGWRVAYPEDEARNIRELAEVAKKHKVDFVWAIHPGQDIKWNEEDFQNLLRKFNLMYELGVRSFAVFFDDISGEGTNPSKQASLLNRLHKEFVVTKGDVTPLIMCPTEYNKSWANPGENGYLRVLGRELDPAVEIMWTGDRVCADITMETLNWITERINRPVYIWWNFPVTDYVRHKVLLGPSYGLDTKATSKDMVGFVSNPMENAEASKVALYGVADYTWNIKAYDYMTTWEQAIKTIMPNATDAFRTFSIHSSDLEQNGHGYRRDESWETKPIDILNYSQEDFAALNAEFAALTAAPEAIKKSGDDPYLIEELTPWLEQAQLLGKRGTAVMEFIKICEKGDPAMIWSTYLDGVMTAEQLTAYNKNKPGTLVLQPFIDNTRAAIGEKLYEILSGKPLKKITPITSFARKETLPSMIDGNSKTYYYSWGVQNVGDWIGVDLGEIQPVSTIEIEQGRMSKDRDYFQHGVLEWSADNLNWNPLMTIADSTYSIKYKGQAVNARYVRLRATEGISTKNWTAIRRFDINPIQREPIIFTNVEQLSSAKVSSEREIIYIRPILEVITVMPNEYFGIELPMVSKISDVNIDLKKPKATVEYSIDGVNWNKSATEARYIRYINSTNKPEQLNLRQFEVRSSTTNDGNVLNVFDNSYSTVYKVNGFVSLACPAGESQVAILAAKGSKGVLYGIDKAGVQRKLSDINGSFCSVQLPDSVSQIEITGNIILHEVIWRK